MTKVELYGKKQTQYDKKLLDFLACQFIPFGVVDSEEFNNFVEELDKSINLKNSRTYLRQMEQLAAEVSQSINMFCSGFLNICLMINHNNNPGAGGREEGSHWVLHGLCGHNYRLVDKQGAALVHLVDSSRRRQAIPSTQVFQKRV